MKNRFMLAPMTNTQSNENGTLSDTEFQWLTMRAKGGFGITMTCASHVQFTGKGFPGQLGIYDNAQIEGHKRLAQSIKAYNSLAIIQLHHAGMRSPKDLINTQPVSASQNDKFNARALSVSEIDQLKDDFVKAAQRALKAGYDGVEVHGAHGYILTQFLSSEINNREDRYGGSLKNRCRLLFEIIEGIREKCGVSFLIGVRLSPERFGMKLEEVKQICKDLIKQNRVDFLDISLWDVSKHPEDTIQNKTLLDHFNAIDFKSIKWTVSGKITSSDQIETLLKSGVDFVTIGRAAILHYDFPIQITENPNFKIKNTPVSESYLKSQGLGNRFITYMKRWPRFVK